MQAASFVATGENHIRSRTRHIANMYFRFKDEVREGNIKVRTVISGLYFLALAPSPEQTQTEMRFKKQFFVLKDKPKVPPLDMSSTL